MDVLVAHKVGMGNKMGVDKPTDRSIQITVASILQEQVEFSFSEY